MSCGHVRDANVMRTALIAFKYNLKTSQIIKICTGTFDTFDTFLQKVKNARDLGTIVYILIRPIGRIAIKKIESVKSVKSVMSFFVNAHLYFLCVFSERYQNF